MKTPRKLWVRTIKAFVVVLTTSYLFSCTNSSDIKITHGNLVYEINYDMQTKVSSLSPEAKEFMHDFQDSELLTLRNAETTNFAISDVKEEQITEPMPGREWVVSGTHNNNGTKINKVLTVKAFDEFPNMLSVKVAYTNTSGKDIYVRNWKNQNYKILNQDDHPGYWAFQGSSSDARADWIQPITPGYYKKNYMGMNNSDYGGGIPVTSLWRKDAGIAIGHLEMTPKLVSLPTELALDETEAEISIAKFFDYPTLFKDEETIETLETFIMVFDGDYYNSLQEYSQLMQRKGISFPKSEDAAYEPIWCAWGYERNFTPDEVVGTLPKVKELGIKWAVLDDGFQIAEGDWDANPKKYPRGNIEIRELVDKIHSYGLKAKVWWTPLAADPGSKALTETPEMRLFKSDWSPQFITWWDAYYLAPVNSYTEKYTKRTLDLFLKEWNFDGLKMDGQHMNGVAPDHNPASKLEYPEQAVEGLPNFFHMIYDYTRDIKPNAVVENCPCGTCMSFFNMAGMNQAVSSDPLSSWQIRTKGKTYKALIPNTAYYGDHVELSDNGNDFASSFGVGAVLGTKFTWPKDNPTASESFLLTPEKEKVWKKWFSLYNDKMLSKGKYLGELYDLGYDKPETHAISKDGSMYFAFYADKWDGEVELRGLSGRSYSVVDYFNGKDYGTVSGELPKINVEFNQFLLLEVTPN